MFSLLFAAASILGSPNDSSPSSSNPSAKKEESQSYQDLHRRKRRVTYEDLRHISLHDTNDPQKEKMLRVMTRSLRR